MSAPHFTILTQQEIPLNLSRPAMEFAVAALEDYDPSRARPADVQCELDNFRNLLQNLLDRSEPETGNLDLIGG